MSEKKHGKKPDSKKPPKRRKAIRSRRTGSKPAELYQQEPEPELNEGEGPRPKGPGGKA